MTGSPARPRVRPAILTALALLYTAQGIPFGFATEYLPVVLREQGYTYAGIAALGYLQLPWQLKVLWAKAADAPKLRAHTRKVILALQMGLTLTVAGFALRSLGDSPLWWFVLTGLAAALAATQDVFVDAFAVRVLSSSERGYGNTAQVAGYRAGMLVGGAALLLLVGRWGERATLLACAGVVAAASIGAFASGEGSNVEGSRVEEEGERGREGEEKAKPASVRALLRRMIARDARPVLVMAMTFKMGMHMAASLLKPMAKDFGWTKEQIGWAMVTVGSASALTGAAVGGVIHRNFGERRALGIAIAVQTLVCVPLVFVERMHAPLGMTTIAIAAEHFGSGLGTTVLFAALMTATRKADAGLHYTILTSANAASIGLGSLIGGVVADKAGLLTVFVIASVVCAMPALLLPKWNDAAKASAT